MRRCLNLHVRIGLVFFKPANPDFKMVGISLLNLIDLPVLDFKDQKAVLVPEKNKSQVPYPVPR